jgi:aspartate/methionine/tyrosine aminotransferase
LRYKQKIRIISRNLQLIHANIGVFEVFLERYSDWFVWTKPRAGSVAFPELTSKYSVEDFCDKLLKNKNVLLLPASIFDYAGNNFRIGFGRRDFNEGLHQVAS